MKQIFVALLLIVGIYAVSAQVSTPKAKTENASSDSAKYTCPMHHNVVSDKPGKCPECGMDLVKSKPGSTSDPAKTYTCPMHGDVMSKEMGKCPKCGMQLSEMKAAKNGKKKGMMACCMKS